MQLKGILTDRKLLVAYWDLKLNAITVTSNDAIKPTIRAGKMVFRSAADTE